MKLTRRVFALLLGATATAVALPALGSSKLGGPTMIEHGGRGRDISTTSIEVGYMGAFISVDEKFRNLMRHLTYSIRDDLDPNSKIKVTFHEGINLRPWLGSEEAVTISASAIVDTRKYWLKRTHSHNGTIDTSTRSQRRSSYANSMCHIFDRAFQVGARDRGVGVLDHKKARWNVRKITIEYQSL